MTHRLLLAEAADSMSEKMSKTIDDVKDKASEAWQNVKSSTQS